MLLFYDAENVATRHNFAAPLSVRAIWPVNHAKLHGELISVNDAASIIAPWRALSDELAEENPFFEPWALLPALQHFADPKVKLACIWRGPGREQLVGFAPMRVMRGYARLPLRYWATWMHRHCYYGAPLIRRGYEKAAMAALMELLCDGPHSQAMLRLPHLASTGAAARAVAIAADDDQRHHYSAGEFSRAALIAGGDAAATPEAVLGKKRAGKLQRQRNRLGERGNPSIRTLTDGRECARWTEEFLALEGKGWKGQRGTSLNSHYADADWFRAAVKGAFEAGKLRFMRLDLDGRPIAMLVGWGAGSGCSFKTCYDPEFARYSPGVLLEIENTKALLSDPDFAMMDSCAASDHPMINSLWKGRRTITGVNISGRAPVKRVVVRLCQALEDLRAMVPGLGS
ncbi:MAG: GNAT family N-acetyltransferase [Alphaproteobacteria bacterium]|nr:GNAT family N-acetyltransferase [Alphaproteobacteria bacterium]